MNGFKNISINKRNGFLFRSAVGIIVVFLFVLVLNFFSAPVKNFFNVLSYPAQKVFFVAGETTSGFFKPLFNAGNLAKDNEDLKKENQRLLSRVFSLQTIISGNQALSDISESCQDKNFDTVMAEIYGLDGQDMLSINKGSADGISEGMPVINQQGVLFGKVFKVYKDFSKVILVSNKDSVISVRVQRGGIDPSAGETSGVLKGSGGLSAYLDLVPVDEEINEGDILSTSVLEKNFPNNLLVGEIIRKEKNDQKPFQQAEVKLFFNLDNINNLFIITNYKQES